MRQFSLGFPDSTKIRRAIFAHVLGLQIRSLPYHDTPKICCMNSPSAGLKTEQGSLSVEIHIICTFSSLKTGMVDTRENDAALIASVTFPFLSTDSFFCPVWLQMLWMVKFLSPFLDIIPLPRKSHSHRLLWSVIFINFMSMHSLMTICLLSFNTLNHCTARVSIIKAWVSL